jgi:hypothetical protein
VPWQFADGVKVASCGDTAFLLDVSRAKYFGLNEIGTEVCLGIEANEDTESIVRRIECRYSGADHEQIVRDVLEFLNHLDKLNICRKDRER